MEIIGYLATVLMGATLGLLGGGGSILTVPILVYLFGLTPSVATGYSLFIVGSTALIGSLSYIRKGEIRFKTVLNFAIPGLTGVYLTRSFLLPSLPEYLFDVDPITVTEDIFVMSIFAFLMFLASISMIRSRKSKTPLNPPKKTRPFLTALQSFSIGVVAGTVGAGGGFLIVPSLVVIAGQNMKTAVGTSLVIISINSLIGFTGDLGNHESINWLLLLSVSGIATIGILIGYALSRQISDANLKKIFGWFVLIMGTTILIDQILKV